MLDGEDASMSPWQAAAFLLLIVLPVILLELIWIWLPIILVGFSVGFLWLAYLIEEHQRQVQSGRILWRRNRQIGVPGEPTQGRIRAALRWAIEEWPDWIWGCIGVLVIALFIGVLAQLTQ